ncbi:MAG: site-2 protease family protein [Phycisphaerae bacterium]|nr:site-2 protease family protein [Phycisphaerae bacterium]
MSGEALAMVEFSRLMIAALLCWVLCVCVHEFSHALVAYIGGDRSVRERGYLSLDPTKFIDPVSSLLIPAIVLMLGGVPLPGGAVRIDESALRNRHWQVAMSAAGPVSNLVLFLLFAMPLHPMFGLVESSSTTQPTWVYFLGAMASLNFIGALFNLIPCPPLDGYRIIEHRLPRDLQERMRHPQAAMAAFGVLFVLIWTIDDAMMPFYWMLIRVCDALNLPAVTLFEGLEVVLFNRWPG